MRNSDGSAKRVDRRSQRSTLFGARSYP